MPSPLGSVQPRLSLARQWPAGTGSQLACGIVAALTVLAVVFALAPIPSRAPSTAIGALVVAIFSIATVFALLRSFTANEERRAAWALAIGIGAGATANVLTFVVFTLRPAHLAIDPGDAPNAGIWAYFLWYGLELIGVFAYVVQRRALPAAVQRAAIVLAGIGCAALVVAYEGIIWFAPAMLPQILRGASLEGFRTWSVPLFAAIAASAVAAAWMRKRTDRAVAAMQVVLGLGLCVAMLSIEYTSPSFLFAQLLQFCGVSVVLIAAVKWKADEEFRQLVFALSAVSDRRAERIQAIWEMSAVQDNVEARRLTRMLELSCAGVRPGKAIRATLSHLDGENVVYDAVAWTQQNVWRPGEQAIFPGSVLPRSRAVQGLLKADGKSRAWDDISRSEIAGRTLASDLGIRSLIAATVLIGQRDYFIVFSSTEPMEAEPFTNDDLAYVDIVASIFAGAFRQFEYVDRLRHHMEHDALTGLQNRVQFRNAVRAAIARKVPFAVALVNLDGFRTVNERYGQMLGDDVLVEIAFALSDVDAGNFVARLDGDEFGVILRGSQDPPALARDSERYLQRFRSPFHTGDRDGTRVLAVGASLGCAAFPDHGETLEDLMRSANVALEVAKERGGGTAAVFDASMERIVTERTVAVSELMNALANDEFRLVYQPTFELRSRRITGAEALLRWSHPERGEVMPGNFIPMAEQAGVIGLLSLWVLARVTRDLADARLPENFRCYFNLAASDLADFTFVRALTDALAKQPWLANRIGVEITETTAMQNVERSLNTIGIIRSLGVPVAIDDFGTGYSSLSYLKRLSVDLIKIDRAFIADLPVDERDAALAGAMISICDRFKTASLAEGIETEAQLDWLADHGCRYGQGYLISRPIEFGALLSRLHSQHLLAS